MSEHRHFIKSASIITALTFLSRIFGYIRDLRVSVLLGGGTTADAFWIAYRIPNMLRRLVGEGAVSAAFIPIFSQYLAQEKRDEAWRLANGILTALTIFLAAATVLGIVFSPMLVRFLAWGFDVTPGKLELTAVLNRIMFPYIFLISLSALAMGILNSFHKFAAPAFAPVLLNLAIIAFSFIAEFSQQPEIPLAVGVVVGGILQLAIQVPPVWKSGWRPRLHVDFTDPALRRVAMLMVPVVFGVGIVQVNVVVSSQFASLLEEGSVTALYLADRVMELMLGGYVIALSTAILPLMARQAAQQHLAEMKSTLNFATRLVLFITLPSTVGLVVLSAPIIEVLFQHGDFTARAAALTAWALVFYGIGLPAFSLMKIIVPAFYALQDTRTPVNMAFVAMFLNIGFNILLIEPLQQGGPALATTLSAFFNALVLMFIFYRRHGTFGLTRILQALAKFAVASTVLGIAASVLIHMPGFYFDQPKPQKILALSVTIAASGVAYFLTAFALRAREFGELREIFLKRRTTPVAGAASD